MDKQNSTESPASLTIKMTSPNGYEVLLTIRDFENKELTRQQIAHLLNLDKTLKASGFTPIIRGGYGPKQARPIEYVEGKTCPKDGGRLIVGTGKIKERCENYKWGFKEKKNIGSCNYLVWNQPKEVQT